MAPRKVVIVKPIPAISRYRKGNAPTQEQTCSSGRIEYKLEMNKRRTRSGCIRKVVTSLEDRLHEGKLTIDPV